MYYYGPMDGDGWGNWGISLIMMLVWLALLAVLAAVLVRYLRGGNHAPNNSNDPLDAAKMRYAKGEITKEQFEQLKKDLKK